MKTIQKDVLYGLVVANLSVPASADEFGKVVGDDAMLLDSGTDDVVYRNVLPRLYRGVAEKVIGLGHKKVAQTKDSKTVTRKTGKGDTAKEVDVLETDIAFIARVWQEGVSGDAEATKALQEQIAGFFVEVSSTLSFYEEGTRGGAGKVSAENLQAANNWLSSGNPDDVTRRVGIIEGKVPGYKVIVDADGNYTAEALARGIAALNKHIEMEKKREANALLA